MSIDWRKKELEFETPEGTARYVYTGTLTHKKEVRKWGKFRGRETWEADGIEEEPLNGDCMRCKQRTFICDSHPIRADSEVGNRIAHFVKNSGQEPPSVYCGDCVYIDNPNLLQQIMAGERNEPTEEEKFLARMTAALGGTR